MGNSECQKCLSAETEMFAEILMGKDKDDRNNSIVGNHNNINNSNLRNNSYSNIKRNTRRRKRKRK